METSHAELAELLGAYALDAVDGLELDEIERHLAECPKCAAEVADHREVAAMMAYTGAPAPEGLWSRIVETLEEAPPALDLSMFDGRRAAAVFAAAAPEPSPVTDELAGRRAARGDRQRLSLVGAVAAVALIVGLVGGSVITSADAGSGDVVAVADVSLESVARQVLNDPAASHISLASLTDPSLTATAAVQSDGSGYLLGTSLPALDESLTYQLWAVRDDAIISLGTLGHTPDVAAFHVAEGTTSLVITTETSGGVTSSSNPALLVGNLT